MANRSVKEVTRIVENMSQEAAQILKEGNIPTGTLTITEPGTYDVSQYASVKVEITIPENYEGPYTVTENATLSTKGKVMTDNLEVNVPKTTE